MNEYLFIRSKDTLAISIVNALFHQSMLYFLFAQLFLTYWVRIKIDILN